jgi:HK97 family phage major capsid protein
MSLQQLREKRAEAVQQMKAIVDTADAEDRDLSEDETQLYDAYKQDVEQLDKRIERRLDVETREEQLQQPEQTATQRQPIERGGPEAKREFESLGEFMHAVRFNPNDQRLNFEQPDVRGEQRYDEGSQGGFVVPQQFRQTIMSVDPQEAIVRPRAEVIEAGTPPDAAITMPSLDQTGTAPHNRYGGVQVEWIGEGATKPETDMSFREITLQPHEVAGHTVVTDKLLRNWQAAESFLERQLRGAMIQAQDLAFLRGDGVAKPQGMYQSPAVYTVNRNSANDVQYVDLVEMEARLHGAGVWLISKAVLPKLRQLQDPQGSYIWTNSAREGEPARLLGLPVVINERNPGLGTKGDISLLDMSYYLIKDGSGPFVAASEHVHFTKNKTVVKIFTNVDGQGWLTEPFKEENGYEVSPFVLLDVPS